MRHKRPYTYFSPAFKAAAVNEVLNTSRTAAQVAHRLHTTEQNISRWIARAKKPIIVTLSKKEHGVTKVVTNTNSTVIAALHRHANALDNQASALRAAIKTLQLV